VEELSISMLKTSLYGGRQVPEWNMTAPDKGITVELSPEEGVAE